MTNRWASVGLAIAVVTLVFALVGATPRPAVQRHWATQASPLLGGGACWAAEGDADEPKPLAVGDEAPDFKLQDISARNVRLKDVLERKAVLLAFFATWHPKSRTQIAALKPVADDLKDEPLEILAVALDRGGKDVVKPFAEEQALNFRVLIDPELTTKDKYQVKATLPLAFVIGQDGKIKAIGKSLDDETIKRLRQTVNAEIKRIKSAEVTGAGG